jgi:hypothetical protein
MALSTKAREQRAALLGLTSRAASDLQTIWRQVNTADALKAKAALLEVVPPLGDTYSLASAALAADWYDSLREEKGARRRFSAEPAGLVDRSRYEALVGWAISPLFGAEPDAGAMLSNLDGGLQRIVANAYRETVTTASVRDPSARGWAREGVGECDFCQMLIGRGAVYTEATADFESHDRCHCIAVPAF